MELITYAKVNWVLKKIKIDSRVTFSQLKTL
jgi:hypothetical protein